MADPTPAIAPKKRRGRPRKIVVLGPPAQPFPHVVDDQLELPAIAEPAIAAAPPIAIAPEVARIVRPSPAPRPTSTGTPCRVCLVDDGEERVQRDLHLRCIEGAVPRKPRAPRAPRPARAPAIAPAKRGRLAVIARVIAKQARRRAKDETAKGFDPDAAAAVDDATEGAELPFEIRLRELVAGDG